MCTCVRIKHVVVTQISYIDYTLDDIIYCTIHHIYTYTILYIYIYYIIYYTSYRSVLLDPAVRLVPAHGQRRELPDPALLTQVTDLGYRYSRGV